MHEQVVFSPENILSIISCLPVLALPFSKQIRKLIGQRDNWQCQDCGETFRAGVMVHASHYNHDKRSPDYDTVEAGRIQCVNCHQNYHEQYVGHADQIGMSEAGNDWAISQLMNTSRYRRE